MGDLVATLMAATVSPKATTWEKKCSPFFTLCNVIDVDPFSFLQSTGQPFVHTVPGELESNCYKLKKLGKIPAFLKVQIKKGHELMEDMWNLWRKAMEERHSNKFLKIANSLQYRNEL